MRPPTPSISSILASAAYIRDPSVSPTRLQSPIDTFAQYLTSPVIGATAFDTAEDPELTPSIPDDDMQYAATFSPLLQHQREHQQQLHALQNQQCIPGLSQIYTPLAAPVFAATTVPTQMYNVSSPSAVYDDTDGDLDDDYVPGNSTSFSRKRSSSPGPDEASAFRDSEGPSEMSAGGAPAPKRQRAAPSGPISTKDWVPPDVTGLNKREARLVKNRAAAFLSRQRKREEFEAMEIRVQELEAENARLRQTAPASASSPSPSSPSFLSSSSAQQTPVPDHVHAILAQLAESQKREELLAHQLRDAQATLAAAPAPATVFAGHQPVISAWPTVGKSSTPPASVIVKEEAMEEDVSTPSTVPSSVPISHSSTIARPRLSKSSKHSGGNVALMVLLFSLSLLSGQKDGKSGKAARADGTRADEPREPSQFSFALPAPTAASSAAANTYDFRRNKREEGDNEPTGMDSLDDEFGLGMGLGLDHLGSASSAAGLAFDNFGFDDLNMNFPMPQLGLGVDNTLASYPSYPSFAGSFFSPSMTSVSTPPTTQPSAYFSSPSLSASQRAMSPSAASTTSSSAHTAFSQTQSRRGSNLLKQLEISVSSISAVEEGEGVKFDLKMAPATSSEEGMDVEQDSSSSVGEESGKRITVRVRKVAAPSEENRKEGKKAILVELSSDPASQGVDGLEDELDALNTDFESLLNGSLGQLPGLLDASEQAEDNASGLHWRLALGPRAEA